LKSKELAHKQETKTPAKTTTKGDEGNEDLF